MNGIHQDNTNCKKYITNKFRECKNNLYFALPKVKRDSVFINRVNKENKFMS